MVTKQAPDPRRGAATADKVHQMAERLVGIGTSRELQEERRRDVSSGAGGTHGKRRAGLALEELDFFFGRMRIAKWHRAKIDRGRSRFQHAQRPEHTVD